MTMLDAEGTYATCACNNLERFNTVGVAGASTEVAEEVPDFGTSVTHFWVPVRYINSLI